MPNREVSRTAPPSEGLPLEGARRLDVCYARPREEGPARPLAPQQVATACPADASMHSELPLRRQVCSGNRRGTRYHSRAPGIIHARPGIIRKECPRKEKKGPAEPGRTWPNLFIFHANYLLSLTLDGLLGYCQLGLASIELILRLLRLIRLLRFLYGGRFLLHGGRFMHDKGWRRGDFLRDTRHVFIGRCFSLSDEFFQTAPQS